MQQLTQIKTTWVRRGNSSVLYKDSREIGFVAWVSKRPVIAIRGRSQGRYCTFEVDSMRVARNTLREYACSE